MINKGGTQHTNVSTLLPFGEGPGERLLYEDNHVIIVAKRAGDIVQGDKTGDVPLSDMVKQYIKERYQKPGEVFLGVVHRLDRPVSGVVLFARTSSDGKTWHNMPGSPVRIDAPKLNLGIYQTTYLENLSWAKLKNIIIYQR